MGRLRMLALAGGGGVAVLAALAHLLAGTTGLLVLVLLLQVVLLLAVAKVGLDVRRLPAGSADPDEQIRAVESLLQRHTEHSDQVVRDAVMRLEAALADELGRQSDSAESPRER